MFDLAFTFTLASAGVWVALIIGSYSVVAWRNATEDLSVETRSPQHLRQSIWVPVLETVFLIGMATTLAGLVALNVLLWVPGTIWIVLLSALLALPLLALFVVRPLPGFRGQMDIRWDAQGITGPGGRYTMRRLHLPWSSLIRVGKRYGTWIAEDMPGQAIHIHAGYLGRGSFLEALREHRPDLHSHLSS